MCLAILELAGVSNLLVSLGHTGRRVVLGHTLNTLQHIITKKSYHVLSKVVILCWAAFIATWDVCGPRAAGWTPPDICLNFVVQTPP